MKFEKRLSARQLNRAEGMTFHPISGDCLAELEFVSHGKYWRKRVGMMHRGWGLREMRYEDLPVITGQQRLYEVGDLYPSHWRFDPWTGEEL